MMRLPFKNEICSLAYIGGRLIIFREDQVSFMPSFLTLRNPAQKPEDSRSGVAKDLQ
jgi:hypothetical protein